MISQLVDQQKIYKLAVKAKQKCPKFFIPNF